jgi:hypothetical protein
MHSFRPALNSILVVLWSGGGFHGPRLSQLSPVSIGPRMATPPTPGLPPLSSTSCHLLCSQNTTPAITQRVHSQPTCFSLLLDTQTPDLYFFGAGADTWARSPKSSVKLHWSGTDHLPSPPLLHFTHGGIPVDTTLAFSPRPGRIPSLCYDRLWRSSSILFPVPTKSFFPRSCAQCQKHFTK